MIKRLLQEVKEFKKASLAAPLFMVGEVLLEISLPFLMSYIIEPSWLRQRLHRCFAE